MHNLRDYYLYMSYAKSDLRKLNAFLDAKGDEISKYLHQQWCAFNALQPEDKLSALLTPPDVVATSPEDTTEEPSLPENNVTPEPIQPEPIQPEIPDNVNEQQQDKHFAIDFRNKHISLQNGKAGQAYQMAFSLQKMDLDIMDYWFEGLEQANLHFDPDTDIITGTPQQAGEYKIQLKCKRNDWEEGKPVFERDITLIINPDPKSLWKSKPSDETDPYWKPDETFDSLIVPARKSSKKAYKDIIAASRRGRSHAHEGTCRDDDFGMAYDDTAKWYTMTVGDGAGSAKYSRKGAKIACETVVDVCHSQLSAQYKEFDALIHDFNLDRSDARRKKLGDALYQIIGSAVFKAYKNIELEAQTNKAQTRDYATTLIVSISKKFDFGWFVGAFWVGDGGIGIYNKDTRSLKILGEADGGEFAGQTRFLTMSEIMQAAEIYRRLRFDIVDDFTALVLMTDGVTDPKFDTDANLHKIEKWDALWGDLSQEVNLIDDNPEAAEQLLQWLDFWSPGNHDDRTIAILY